MAERGSSVLVSDQDARALTDRGAVWEIVSVMLPAVGLALRCARLRRGFMQERVAERIGVSPSVLSRLERGERWPRLTTVLALCTLLGVRFSDILRAAEDEACPIGTTPWTEPSSGGDA